MYGGMLVRIDWKIVSDISPERQINEETDVYCVWQGRRLFCEFPLEWDFEVLLRKMFRKTWVWRLVI